MSATEFPVGARVYVEEEQDTGVVFMSQDPQAGALDDQTRVAVRLDKYEYSEHGYEYLISPENPRGLDYHTFRVDELQYVESLEDAEAEVLERIAESARRKDQDG